MESEEEDAVSRKLKKAVRLSKKLQDKLEFEREVSRELARRNDQLKKDFTNENLKYKTLVLAFEDLYLEFKDLLDGYGDCLTNGLPPPGSESYQRLNTTYEQRLTFFSSIRSKAGIERNVASDDILNLMSGSSLLRKSTELNLKPNPPSPHGPESAHKMGMRKAASQKNIPIVTQRPPSRRQSTMSLSSTDSNHFGDINFDSLSLPSSIPNYTDLFNKAISDLQQKEFDSDDDLLLSADSINGSDKKEDINVPLFEHFLVIGVSVDTSVDISNEIIDKHTRMMRGRIRNTIDLFFGRSNQNKLPSTGVITPANLASRQNSVTRLASRDSDLQSDTASITSERSREIASGWRGSIFGRRPSTRQLTPDHLDVETAAVSISEQSNDESPQQSATDKETVPENPVNNSAIPDSAPNTPQSHLGWSARFARMMATGTKHTEDNLSTPEANKANPTHSTSSIPETRDSESHSTDDPTEEPEHRRGQRENNSTWRSSLLMRLGVSTAVHTVTSGGSGSESSNASEEEEEGGESEQTPDTQEQQLIPPPQLATPRSTEGLPPLPHTASPAAPPPPPMQIQETIKFADPEILYRFPEDADPPPSQICGFCLPNGAKLKHLAGEDEENKIVEILYGENHDFRSARCFIFILEDKTLDIVKSKPDDERGIHTGRTYGICVIHPKWLNVAAEDRAGRLMNPDGSMKASLQFETHACYCFITRFPLFDFFFKVIWSMISYERIVRMQNITSLANDRCAYEYLPVNVYDSVLERLTTLSPPKYDDTLTFQISPLVAEINYQRFKPQSDSPEHLTNAAEWALPPLLHWLDSSLIAWALGLLMCEVKFIVIGREPAMVSCAVIGLLSLLKPLHWLNPVIPFIPTQFMEFMQSIPPIIGGIVVDPHSTEDTTPLGILQYIGDYDSVSAVLDLTTRDIFVLSKHGKSLNELLLPGGRGLITAMEHIKSGEEVSSDGNQGEDTTKPRYTSLPEQLKIVKLIQEGISLHLQEIADSAKSVAGEVIRERMNEVERRNKEILKRIHNLRSSFTTAGELNLTQVENLEDDTEVLNGELITEENLPITQIETVAVSQSNQPRDDPGNKEIEEGDVESVISIKNYPFPSNGSSRNDYQKFLRRFVSTQMFSEYDKDIVGMLRDVETVSIVQKE